MKCICKHCNTEFEVEKRTRQYCTYTCRMHHYRSVRADHLSKYKAQYYQDNKSRIDHRIRQSRPKPKQYELICPVCNTQFVSYKDSAVCCSKACSDKHWRQNHKDYINESFRERYQTDINRRLASCLRSRLNKALKGAYKQNSLKEYLGCSVDELKQHLESQFAPGMTWLNYGQWHIDHIQPLAYFDLTKKDDFLQANHYTNLQPLWAIDNIKKSNNLV